MTMLDTIDGKMPCSITDDPLNDYSHYEEGTGPYKQTEEEDCFDAFKKNVTVLSHQKRSTNLMTMRARLMDIDQVPEYIWATTSGRLLYQL